MLESLPMERGPKMVPEQVPAFGVRAVSMRSVI